MSEDRVVSLRGGALPPATRTPRPHVISLLEEALEDARSGRIQSIAVAMMDDGGNCGWQMAGMIGASYGLIGAMQVMAWDLTARTRTGIEED